MISAVDAKKITNNCDINRVNKELERIEELIKTAAEKGYWKIDFDGRGLSIGNKQKIKNVLQEFGYEINGCSISWEDAKDEHDWVERKRYDGSIFYVCGSCGGVAAAEKEDNCPNCKCRMRK